jgi:predicted transcriptional regulator
MLTCLCGIRQPVEIYWSDQTDKEIEGERTVGTLGELERSVMDAIWVHDDGLSAAELREVLSDRELALTTVHTVLSRLEKKGFVTRDRSIRPHRYVAVSTREDHVAELMTEMLSQAPDRQAVLARFLGTVSEADTKALRNLLGRNHSTQS